MTLILCAGVLAAFPAPVAAASDFDAWGAGGGGGAGGAPGVFGGKGGANGLGEAGVTTGNDSGGAGATGGYTGIAMPVPGGAGGDPGAGKNGKNPQQRVEPPALSGPYGNVTATGGNGGDIGYGSAPGMGGHGGSVDLYLADGVSAASLTLTGGEGGSAGEPGSGYEGSSNWGGTAWGTALGAATIGAITLQGGDGGGQAFLEAHGALTADTINIINSDVGGIAGLRALGPLTATDITVGGGNRPGLGLLGGLVVPAGKTTNLTVNTGGEVTWAGAGSTAITLGDGAVLNIVNNSGSAMAIAGNVALGAGAVVDVSGGSLVSVTGTVNTSLSGPPSYDMGGTTPLALVLNNDLLGVTSVDVGGYPMTLGTDYTVSGRSITITAEAMRRVPLGSQEVGVQLSNNSGAYRALTLTDSRPPSLTVNFDAAELAFEASLDGGATWLPLESGVALDTSPAQPFGGSIMVRQRRGFLNTATITTSPNANVTQAVAGFAWNFVMTPANSASGPNTVDVGGINLRQVGLGSTVETTTYSITSDVPQVADARGIIGVLLGDTRLLQKGAEWTDVSGGTYAVQLSEALLASLPEGQHTVYLVLETDASQGPGYVSGSFTVARPAPTPTPTPQAAAAATTTTAAPSPQTGDIGTGPYIVFAISGGLMLVWLGMQVFKRRDKDD